MATKDFRASQVRTSQIIGSGSEAGKPSLLIISASDSSGFDGQALSNSALLSGVGSDVFLFVTGSKNTRTNVTLFGGDVVISGTVYAERQVVEVDLSATGSLSVSGSLIVSQSATIQQGLTVNSGQGITSDDNFLVYGGPTGGTSAIIVNDSITRLNAGTGASSKIQLFSLGSAADAVRISSSGGIDIDADTEADVNIAGGTVTLQTTGDGTIQQQITLDTNVETNDLITIQNRAGTTEDSIKIASTAGGVDIDAASGKNVAVNGGQVLLQGADSVLDSVKLTSPSGGGIEIAPGSLGLKVGGSSTPIGITGSDIRLGNSSVEFGTGGQLPPQPGLDSFLFVSGAIGSRGTTTKGTAVFGGDTVVSGTTNALGVISAPAGISGSLTQLTDGTSYLIAGSNVTITSGANGSVTIAASSGGSGEWTDGGDFIYPSDGGGESIVIGGADVANADIYLKSDGAAVFNGQNAAVDFRVASDNKTHALFVDGSTDQVLILSGGGETSTNEAAGADISFYVSGSRSSYPGGGGYTVAQTGLSVFGGDVATSGTLYVGKGATQYSGGGRLLLEGMGFNEPQIRLDCKADGALGGALTLNLDSSSPGDDDVLGSIFFAGNNDASTGSTVQTYATIKGVSSDITDNDEGGKIVFEALVDSTNRNILSVGGYDKANNTPAEVVVNEDSDVVNLRVESNNKTHALFVDGSTDQVLILSGGGETSYDEASGTDVNFYVSGTVGSKGTSTKGTSVFGGDVFVSGTLYTDDLTITDDLSVGDDATVQGELIVSQYVSHLDDSNTRINFQDNDLKLEANGLVVIQLDSPSSGQKSININNSANDVDFIVYADALGKQLIKGISEASNEQVLILSGGSETSFDESSGADVGFYVSGTVGSKGTSTKGAAVFGGDTVVSGTFTSLSGISGSLTQLADGTSYLIAGDNVTISTGSSGAVTIAAASGGGGGGSGDPNATYVVISATGSLNGERVLTAGTGISLADAGAGNAATLSIDNTAVATLTGSQFSGNVGVTGSIGATLGATIDGGTVFNEQGAAVDFRVEGDGKTHAIYVNGVNDFVEIGAGGAAFTNQDVSVHLSGTVGSTSEPDSSILVSGDLVVSGVIFGGESEPGDGRELVLLSKVITVGNTRGEEFGEDVNFFVSGSVGSKDTSEVGTSLFGGDVVISGTLHGQNIHVSEYIYHRDDTDSNTYIQFAEDSIGITAGGEQLITVSEAGQDIVKIGDGGDVDFQVRTSGDDNTLYVQGSSDRIGVGTNSPASLLHLKESAPTLSIQRESNSNDSTVAFLGSAGATGAIMHLSGGNDLVFKTHDGSTPDEMFRIGSHYGSLNRQIIFLSGSDYGATSMQPKQTSDIAFFVSGAVGSRGTSTKGTSVFGGDLFVSGAIHTVQPVSITHDSTSTDALLITSTESGADAAPIVTLKRNSSSPANADYLGQVKFKGENDNDEEIVYAKITGKIGDKSDGAEDGIIEFAAKNGGSNTIIARVKNDGFAANSIKHLGDTSNKIDFSTGQVLILSGGSDASFDEASGADVSFYVSGTAGSKGTSTKGASVFGGDLVVSGGLHVSGTDGTPAKVYIQSSGDDGSNDPMLEIRTDKDSGSSIDHALKISSPKGVAFLDAGLAYQNSGIKMQTGGRGFDIDIQGTVSTSPLFDVRVIDSTSASSIVLRTDDGGIKLDLDATSGKKIHLDVESTDADSIHLDTQGGVDIDAPSGVNVSNALTAAALSGSLTHLSDGTSYLIAGSNVTITTGSSGAVTIASSGGGGGGISFDGSTANGVLTFKDSDEATVESDLTFDGSTLNIGGTNGVDISDGSVSIKNAGSVSNVKFYCESGNAHYTQLQSAPHSEYGGNRTLTLPPATGRLLASTDAKIDEYLYHTDDTDTYLRFTDNNVHLAAGSKVGAKLSTDQVLILSGGAAASTDESSGADVAFYVSGSTSSASTSTRGTSLFGGDLVASGTILPGTDLGSNLGAPTRRFGNIYTGDLHLRNDRGDWTIVEEADYLCVVNNLTGKKFKMALIPLDEE